MPIPKGITRDDVEAALVDLDSAVEHSFGDPTPRHSRGNGNASNRGLRRSVRRISGFPQAVPAETRPNPSVLRVDLYSSLAVASCSTGSFARHSAASSGLPQAS